MINKYSRDMLRAVLFILAATLAQPALSAEETAPTKSDMEELRDKIYADKKLIVSENMDLTEEEASKFWPIYQAYQEDLHKINERMAKLINEYALSYNKGAILDKTARQLIDQAVDIEMDEAKLGNLMCPSSARCFPGQRSHVTCRSRTRFEPSYATNSLLQFRWRIDSDHLMGYLQAG